MHIRPSPGAHREPEGVEVELVETDDWTELAASAPGGARAVPSDDEVPEGAGAREREPRRRRYAGRSAVAAAAVVLLVVGINVVQTRRHAAEVAALGELSGFLAPLDDAPVAAWRVPGRAVGQAAGLVLVSDATAGRIHAIDPATGTVRWSFAGEGRGGAAPGFCAVVDEQRINPAVAPDPLPAARPSDPDVVTCLGDPLPPPEGPASAMTLVWFLDAQNGLQLGSHTVHGTLVMVDAVERDLLVVAVREDGRLEVVRLTPRTGEPVWTYTSPDAMFGRYPLMIQALDRRGDALVVDALSGELAVSMTTGASVDPEEAAHEPSTSEVTHLPGGATAVWQPRPDGTSGTGRVLDGDGRRAYALSGPVQRAATRDASLPETLVVASATGTRLRGLNLRTGRQLWSTEVGPASSTYPVAQVRGVLVLERRDALTALDLRDGSTLWTAPRDATVHVPGLTDGEVVLVAQRDDGQVLSARTLSDGAEVWRTALPDGTTSVFTVGGLLLAEAGDSVVGLG